MNTPEKTPNWMLIDADWISKQLRLAQRFDVTEFAKGQLYAYAQISNRLKPLTELDKGGRDFIKLLNNRIEIKEQKVNECSDVLSGEFPEHMKIQFAEYIHEHLYVLKELRYLSELLLKKQATH